MKPKSKSLTLWAQAVKKFGSIPKKGTADYKKLQAIYSKLKKL